MSRRRSWCCSFSVPPSSPDNPIPILKNIQRKADPFTKPGPNSVPTSPKAGLNFVDRIDPRRILSPGRVSPIDSDPTADPGSYVVPDPIPAPKSRSESFRERNSRNQLGSSQEDRNPLGSDRNGGLGYDVRINVRGRKGGTCLVLEMNSEVLIANSEVFRGLIEEYFKKGKMGNNEKTSCSRICRIEVGDVENLSVFRETIEFMFDEEEEISRRLLKIGAFRAIDILEVSAGIAFKKGVLSCVKYLEAVPWTEEEEEKLRSIVTRFKLDETATRDIMARLVLLNLTESQQSLARQLVWLITSCNDSNSRNELKSLVKGLLCTSSVYEKDQPDLSKEDLYAVCQSCLDSLVSLLEEACATVPSKGAMKTKMQKPLIERLHMQVDNINWLLEILIDQQMGEEFVDIWTNQDELLKLHNKASPMIRYELSRISANLFIAIGIRKLQCRSETRTGLLETWFGPMLLDFGWLRRCRKGLDIRALEEAMGQTLLTLPLKQQYGLFMEWFRCFSKHGTECPNLSKAFQIWWRRSFLRGSETQAIESR